MKHIKVFKDFIKEEVSLEKNLINEGIYDKNILKVIFMSGGPGSGKSRVVEEIFGVPSHSLQSISYSTGLKIINSDQAFEYELQKKGINPKSLAQMSPAEFDSLSQGPESPRGKAKKITAAKLDLYMKNRLGMLIDGTGDDYEKIKSKKEIIEKLGYDTYMLFVNTSLDVALERNANRSRSLPDALVKEIWYSVQNNIGKFQNLFGIENIIIIDNSLSGIENIKKMEGAVSKLLRKPLQNYIGKQWIKANS